MLYMRPCKWCATFMYRYSYKLSSPTDFPHMFLNVGHLVYNEAFDNAILFQNPLPQTQMMYIQQSLFNSGNNQNFNHFTPQHRRNHNQMQNQQYIFYSQNPQRGTNNFNSINNFKNNSGNSILQEKPYLRGLVNIESTCYMNSVLQCFAHISELANYFKTEKINRLALDNFYNKHKLFPVFQEVIINLWNTWDNAPYSPYNFKKRIGEMNPLFQGAYPNDAKDLMTFILLQLHEELNNPKNNNINNNQVFSIQDQLNKKLMFERFTKNFIRINRSIISGLFFGLFYAKIKCGFCQNKFYNYQIFNFLVFPLEKVLQYKQSLTNFTSNCNNTVTIEDCFKHYQLASTMNDYYCNICKHQVNCAYENKLSISPNVLIIILNRGKGLQYKVNISFENENLGLKNYVEYCKDESLYELIGVVTHYGDSSASGHFMARCKSPIDGNWYLYNDQSVTKIGYFDKKSFSQGNPYILFYKKLHVQ